MDETRVELLVRSAYEEGVEDGIEWGTATSDDPCPQWIDSVARVELLKSTRPDEDKVEAVAKIIAPLAFTYRESGGTFVIALPDEAEAAREKARRLIAAIAAMGHTPPSGEDGELAERARKSAERMHYWLNSAISNRFECEEAANVIDAIIDRLTALLSDVGVLREALEPFARIAELREGYNDKSDAIVCIGIDHVRKARTALQGIGGR
jgi:hypothetical protein